MAPVLYLFALVLLIVSHKDQDISSFNELHYLKLLWKKERELPCEEAEGLFLFIFLCIFLCCDKYRRRGKDRNACVRYDEALIFCPIPRHRPPTRKSQAPEILRFYNLKL
jgi:hypothetical protein